MTVSQVYARPEGGRPDRDAAGLRHLRRRQRRTPGWPRGRTATELHRRIDALIDEGSRAWASGRPSSSRWSARASSTATASAPRTRIVMVGLFPDATASYARFIAAPPRQRRDGRAGDDRSALERDPDARARANSADLAITFANRQREVDGAGARTPRSCRSASSRRRRRGMALASLDPLARVAVVSRFPDFLPIMKAGVQRFAPHVATSRRRDARNAGSRRGCSRDRDVVVYRHAAPRMSLRRLRPGAAGDRIPPHPRPGRYRARASCRCPRGGRRRRSTAEERKAS